MRDKELEIIENKLAEIYTEAQKECDVEIDHYFNGWDEEVSENNVVHHKGMYERLAEQRILFEQGRWRDSLGNPVTDEKEWNKYVATQEGRGRYWINVKDRIANLITNKNITASNYINTQLPSAFVKTSNEIANLAKKSALEKGVLGIRFDLIDEYTLKAIMTNPEGVTLYKPTKINKKKDIALNKEKLQNALYQGVLHGDDVNGIANRFRAVTKMSKSAAYRNARTALTNARSSGKQNRMEDLAKQGCVSTKIWEDVHDHIPPERPEHWEASGQEVPYDEPFIVGGEELMYPGDPSGSGWNINNCRCRMKTGKFIFRSVLDDETRKKANIRVVN